MAVDALEAKAHELIGQLHDQGKLAAVVHLLEVMVQNEDDDGELTPELRQRLAESQDYFANGGQGIPMEDVLADFGLTMDDFPVPRHE